MLTTEKINWWKVFLGSFFGYYSWNVMALVKSSLGNPKQTLKCTQIWQESYLLIFHEYCHDGGCRKKIPGAEKILNFSFAYVCILLVLCTHCSFSTCGWIVLLLANLALNLPHKVTVKLSKNTFGISYFPISNSKCTYRLRGPNFKYKMNFDMSLDCLLKRIWHPWFTNL